MIGLLLLACAAPSAYIVRDAPVYAGPEADAAQVGSITAGQFVKVKGVATQIVAEDNAWAARVRTPDGWVAGSAVALPPERLPQPDSVGAEVLSGHVPWVGVVQMIDQDPAAEPHYRMEEGWMVDGAAAQVGTWAAWGSGEVPIQSWRMDLVGDAAEELLVIRYTSVGEVGDTGLDLRVFQAGKEILTAPVHNPLPYLPVVAPIGVVTIHARSVHTMGVDREPCEIGTCFPRAWSRTWADGAWTETTGPVMVSQRVDTPLGPARTPVELRAIHAESHATPYAPDVQATIALGEVTAVVPLSALAMDDYLAVALMGDQAAVEEFNWVRRVIPL